MTIYFIYSNILCSSTMNSCAASSTDIIPENKRGGGQGGGHKCYASIFFVFYNLYTYKPNTNKDLP